MSTTGWVLVIVAAAIFARDIYRRLVKRADSERAALYARGGEVVPHGKDNVVPLDDLLHEQDSAEAYDDLSEEVFRTAPGARVISRAEYEAMEPEPGVWYWICDFYDADGERLHADIDVRPSDDTVAALHDMSVDEFRARLREQQVAVSAAVAAQRLDVEIFDLCHDARTGGAS